jgi:serine/threonine protein kinase
VVIIARKEVRGKAGAAGAFEGSILRLLERLKHPNIVEFLGSYSYNHAWNLLFPFYPMNLKDFLQRPLSKPSHVIYYGMYGIADALSKLHNFTAAELDITINRTGYHHDLWPANILVDGDKFVITDFGLSSLKADDQNSRSTLRGGQEDYLAPEAFDHSNFTNLDIGRSSDIWALGCILSEISTLIEGREISEFKTAREATHPGSRHAIIDHAFHLDGTIRPAVNGWLLSLEQNNKDPETPELIGLTREMLNKNSFKRIPAGPVTDRLALLVIRSKYNAAVHLLKDASGIIKDSNTTSSVFYLLEQFKLDAWWSTFSCLHLEERRHLTRSLVHTLDQLMSRVATRGEDCDAQHLPLRFNGFQGVWEMVDVICQTLPAELQQKAEQTWSTKVCSIKDLNTLKAIREIQDYGSGRYRIVGAKAAMRYMAQLISQSIQDGAKSRYIPNDLVDYDENLLFRSCNGNVVAADESRNLGTYELGGKVLIEWDKYDASWSKNDIGTEMHQRMDARVALFDPQITPRLGACKQRLLDCIGYFHEPKRFRFGFVYDLKDYCTSETHLYSLNTYLRITDEEIDPEQNIIPRPSLGDRFKLAKWLGDCLWNLHDAGWIHKNISSHQILVFARSETEIYEQLNSAILAGFSHSRQEGSNITLGPRDEEFRLYRHPQYRVDVPFKGSYDYYSFGIVLLELGLWAPVSAIQEVHADINSAEEFRIKLLKSYVSQLHERMGSLYESAVYFCLDAENLIAQRQEQMSADRDSGREMFMEKVLEPLSRCNA